MVKIQNSEEYNSFDIAKLICSILVVMIHIAPFGSETDSLVLSCFNLGLQQGLCRIAVPLFFVFNGFFLGKRTVSESFSAAYIKQYFWRILKLYLFWSLMYLPLVLWDVPKNPSAIFNALAIYLKNLVCTGSYSHLWYLPALLFAAAVISFLLYKKWSIKKILCVSAVFYAVGLLGDGYYNLILPLFEAPILGDVLNAYFTVFETTRNGLFFGFFFVSLGMMLSDKSFTISAKKAAVFFVLSLCMLLTEAFLLQHFSVAKDMNVLLFTIPSALFGFLMLQTIKLKKSTIYMRKISSLIYYGHMVVYTLLLRFLVKFNISVQHTPLPFVLVLGITVIIAGVVIKLSDTKPFRWLKIFY